MRNNHNTKNKLNEKLVRCKDDQNWQIISQIKQQRKKKVQIIKIRNEKESIRIDTNEIYKIIGYIFMYIYVISLTYIF